MSRVVENIGELLSRYSNLQLGKINSKWISLGQKRNGIKTYQNFLLISIIKQIIHNS